MAGTASCNVFALKTLPSPTTAPIRRHARRLPWSTTTAAFRWPTRRRAPVQERPLVVAPRATAADEEWGMQARDELKAAAEVVAVAEEATETRALKKKMLEAFRGTDRGLRASSETRAEVVELIAQLEARNPTPAPTDAIALLDGKWILVYTSFSQLFPLLGSGSLLMKADEISQAIDSERFTVQNSVKFVGPLATTAVSTNASYVVRSPKRVQFQQLGDAEEQLRIEELLRIEKSTSVDYEGNSNPIVNWVRHDEHEGVQLKHFKAVSTVDWHRKGDYFTTVVPTGDTRAILIHQLSKKHTQNSIRKLHGLPVASVFHPVRPFLFVSTKKNVRVYDLLKAKLIKKLETKVREVSSIAIHPGGDNLIVGSKEGKMCWFDMDLSSQPFKTLKTHPKDITNVGFHRSYPLFASCSDDCTAYVFHGMVYSDLNQNPLIVPLEILRGHASFNGGGVLDCKFHPRQPWLFTAGADSLIKLFCH